MLAFYGEWTAPDFKERDNPKGHVTGRAGMLALMAQVAASGSLGGGMVASEASTSIAELAVEGNRAVAVTTNKYRCRQTDTQGWYGVSGAEHEIATVSRWRQTWVKDGKDRRLQVNQLLDTQTYFDWLLL